MRGIIFVALSIVAGASLAACGKTEQSAQVMGAPAAAVKPEVVIYKSPTCSCCGAWEEHIRAAGYTVVQKPTEDMAAVKAAQHVPAALASCHTAVVDGYVIEGHVPASAITRLLTERPAARGLVVPGMPAGSPGMANPGHEGGYDVLLLREDGTTELFERVSWRARQTSSVAWAR